MIQREIGQGQVAAVPQTIGGNIPIVPKVERPTTENAESIGAGDAERKLRRENLMFELGVKAGKQLGVIRGIAVATPIATCAGFIVGYLLHG